jgi:hypothetical protein
MTVKILIPVGVMFFLALGSCAQETSAPRPGRSSDAVVLDRTIDIQSAHPYANGTDQSWTIEAPDDATQVTLVFDDFHTEGGYDFVNLYDSAGELVHRLSGVHHGESFSVVGNHVRIRFTSDGSVRRWGFAISNYSYTTAEEMSDDPSLTRIDSCDGLRDYVAEMTTDMLLERPFYRGFETPLGGAALAKAKDAPSDHTTTNVQEEGVDEADIVETDGQYVYVLDRQDLVIVDSWPREETREVSRINLGSHGYGMFLDGDRVVAFSSSTQPDQFRWGGTRVTVVDVTDREHPRVLYDVDLEGNYVDARAMDGRFYLVSRASFWKRYRNDYRELCEEVECHSWHEAEAEEQEAARTELRELLLPLVRARLDEVPDEELLPHAVDEGSPRPALACTDIHRPWKPVQAGLVMFSTLDLTGATPSLRSAAVIGKGYTVYASPQHIYLAHASRFWFPWGAPAERELSTVVHKLSIPDGSGAPRYEATGKVPGFNTDQFSMSEHDGLLRIATSEEWWGREGNGNGLFVLRQNGRHLEQVGSLRGLSPGQRIFGVRFMGDRGYLVTFEQIDPLHVVDLSDPSSPVELGELEIPGFSTYLHPFAEGLLMGIGRDEDRGIQLSLFDVRDPAHPTRIHQTVVATGGWSSALHEHHAFTYHAERRMLAIPLNNYSRDQHFSGTVVFEVSEEEGFVEVGRVDHTDIARRVHCQEWYTADQGQCFDEERRWWVDMRRNVFIDDSVYSISNVGLSVDNLYEPEEHYAALAWRLGPWTASARPNATIDDYRWLTSSVEVVQNPPCDDPSVAFDLNLAHTSVGDLFIALSDPAGAMEVLRFFEGSDDNHLRLWREPVEGLGRFGVSGNWTLQIFDWGRGDTGTLHSWSVRVECEGARL